MAVHSHNGEGLHRLSLLAGDADWINKKCLIAITVLNKQTTKSHQ